MVAWLCTADKKGILTEKNVQRAWDLACKNVRGRKLQKHLLIETGSGCCDVPEKEVDTIARGNIVVYDV
eukprot:6178315-Pleurochrysis_carterae.AAC.1